MLNLSIGGASWKGFVLKKYSNAKEWRLFLPNGKHFLVLSPQEIIDNWRQAQERPKLIGRINKLEAQCNGSMSKENHALKVEINNLLTERDMAAMHFTGYERRRIFDTLDLIYKKLSEAKVDTPRFDSAYRQVHAVPAKLTYR